MLCFCEYLRSELLRELLENLHNVICIGIFLEAALEIKNRAQHQQTTNKTAVSFVPCRTGAITLGEVSGTKFVISRLPRLLNSRSGWNAKNTRGSNLGLMKGRTQLGTTRVVPLLCLLQGRTHGVRLEKVVLNEIS